MNWQFTNKHPKMDSDTPVAFFLDSENVMCELFIFDFFGLIKLNQDGLF